MTKTITIILNSLLQKYDRVMILKMFVDSNDDTLKNKYIAAADSHNNKIVSNNEYIDAGFDLFAPGNEGLEKEVYGDALRFFGVGWSDASPVNKLDLKVICSAKMYTDTGKSFNTGYYMHPRSSLSKTQLRLANSTGIIDAGYRGHLMGMFDIVNIQPNSRNDECDFYGNKFDRYLQICAPGLVPILVEIVNNINELGGETERGSGGFGSTGR
jgi:dUTP pyrophosphatase